jgi:transposase
MIFCSIDIGRYHHQMLLMDEVRKPLAPSLRFDESCEGHARAIALLRQKAGKQPIVVAFEATGIYYLNIVSSLVAAGLSCTFYRLNPYAVKHYAKASLLRQSDDKISAKVIASMILEQKDQLRPYEPDPQGDLGSLVSEMIELRRLLAAETNRLHREIFLANTEVETIYENLLSGPALAVLERYPTAKDLARAREKILALVRNGKRGSHRVGKENAELLIVRAKQSIASGATPQRGERIRRLIRRIRELEHQISDVEREMEKRIPEISLPESGLPLEAPKTQEEKKAQDIALLDSIPGVGRFGAVAAVTLAGDISRFDTPEQLSAYCGTCPRYSRSGTRDQTSGSMSKRGNKRLRWLLFMLTLSALTNNPVVREYYQRHLDRGKPKMKALAAAMTKMLRLLFGIIKTRKPFDVHHLNKKEEAPV